MRPINRAKAELLRYLQHLVTRSTQYLDPPMSFDVLEFDLTVYSNQRLVS